MAAGRRLSRVGLVLAIGYLAVFATVECLTLWTLMLHAAHSEFVGVGLILVALPWSMMFSPLWNAIGYIDWYNRFAGMPLVYGLLATGTVLPGVVLNTLIAYSLGWVIGRAVRPKTESTE
jgi:hypothetical protein